jgi:gliding motility-associated-like protein
LRVYHLHIVFFIFTAWTFGNHLSAQNHPDIRRVCLDRINGTATIYWNSSNAACSTFSEYEIWGRDDTNNFFSLLKSEPNRLTESSDVLLPNQKRWQFFVVAKYGCPGSPKFNSDTVFIDDQEPQLLELDSVSIDLFDQTLVAGWQRSPANDLQGYYLYRVGASNAIIADTNTTHYRFRTLVSTNSGNRIAIAAYDSCYQAGLISSYHEPILLSVHDSSYCQRLFKLRFSKYVGWPVSKYEVYTWEAGAVGYVTLQTFAPTEILNFDLVLNKRNTTYFCFVRAFNVDGTVSSSSNILSLRSDSVITHSKARIRRVTEINKTIEAWAEFDNPNGKITVGTLLSSVDGSTWNTLTSSANSPLVGYIPNESLKLHKFKLQLEDACGAIIDIPQASNNILLNLEQGSEYNLTWNPYVYWENGVASYAVLMGKPEKPLSTWNTYQLLASDQNNIILDKQEPSNVCYCVLAINETRPIPIPLDSALSNIICPFSAGKLHVPNAFTPNNDGKNDLFSITSSSINTSESEITIFNRWGQIVYAQALANGWPGIDSKGNPCAPGVYAYIIKTVFNDGSSKHIQGTTLLIK